MKLKNVLLSGLSFVLVAALAIGGTVAYLTSEDSDVNVMTLGNVTIEQIEQERGESGLQDFTQGQVMVPAADVTGAKEAITVNGYELNIRTGETYVDKIVSVENTGKSDAYVRTIYAIPEAGDFDTTWNSAEQWFHWNGVSDTDTTPNNGWIWGKDKTTEWPGNTDNWDVVENVKIGEKTYDIYVVTNKNVIKAGEKTAPSLLGFYIDTRVDYNGENYTFTTSEKEYNLGDISQLEVLVLTQAVQADGFSDAWTALDEAFGKSSEKAAEWFGGVEIPAVVNDAESLANALSYGENVVLTENVEMTEEINVTEDAVIDLNSNTLNAVSVANNGNLVVENGTLEAGSASSYAVRCFANSVTVLNDVDIDSAGGGIGAADGAQVTINNCNVDVTSTSTSGRYNVYAVGEGTIVTIEDGEFSFSKTGNQKRAYIYVGEGATVYVNGGTFGAASTRDGYTAGILGKGTVVITGGTFGFNPSTWVAEGYQAVESNGVWTVSAK